MKRKLSTMAAFAVALAGSISAQEVLAIKAGTVNIGNGTEPVENAVILIQDGRIQKIGQGLEIPWNAKVIDASSMYVMPAWVQAHGSGGMDRENENIQVTPYLSVLDSIEPVSTYFEACRRNGIGTIHVLPGNACQIAGRGVVVKPDGKTPEQMAVVQLAGMKMSLQPKRGGRSKHVAELRKALDDAKEHLADLKRQEREFKEDKDNGATTEEEFDLEDKIDPLKKPLLDLIVDKKTAAFLYVPRASDVPTAIRLYRDYKFKTVFILGPDCYKAAKILKSAQDKWEIPMILDPTLEVIDKDPITEEETRLCTAKVFYDEGIIFALSAVTSSSRHRSVNMALTMPWWQIATCVRWGVPEDVAIAAFTAIPARILGLSDRIGTLEEGKDANLQILGAPPLEPECQVKYLLVGGEVIYDRNKDPRVKLLTGRKDRKPHKEGR
ncbi:MAG: amidohydrolase family protein [Planctomycetota bacterium]